MRPTPPSRRQPRRRRWPRCLLKGSARRSYQQRLPADYLQDALSEPDGGFPTVSSGVPAANPGNALRQDLKNNDLRNWIPTSPVLLCAGNSDPTVFFFNTQLMQNYWKQNPPAIAPVVEDVDSAPAAADPYGSFKSDFAAAKALVRTQAILGGASDGGQGAIGRLTMRNWSHDWY